jgi:hypothetical protein
MVFKLNRAFRSAAGSCWLDSPAYRSAAAVLRLAAPASMMASVFALALA